ncbi:efflux RND transporter permease subunit [Fusibacter paucivorans]|uniref:Efflux RND transporter permease subunit n=1 Tax=Fusibacter paucivorans TaxID=76009 RepID=A0ABS5PNY7_9FIRM|nr:efflux RND transporter permease subunit [Fusibacter paucivorans]MBS7526885.1 efflux RND transporter permease subunit [Fusibacter paucivorans]
MTKLALNRPVSAIMFIIAIAVFGIASIFSFKMEMFPSMEVPMLAVTYVYPGAPADIVEEDVVEAVEDACRGLSSLDSYTAYSYENYCTIVFSYQYGVNIDSSYMDLTKALNNIDLPEEVEEPTILEMTFDSHTAATLSLAVQSSDSEALTAIVNDEIIPELEAVSGVAQVTTSGGKENNVQVILDSKAMARYGLSIGDVANYIGSADFNMPVGKFSAENRDITVAASETVHSLSALKQIPMMTEKGSLITLSDIAEIRIDSEDQESMSAFNGSPSITIDLSKAQSANTVAVTEDALNVIEKYAASYPDIAFHVMNNNGDAIQKILISILKTLIIGAVLAMIVIFIFFGDMKASLIVGSSIPLSLLLAVSVMRLFGFTLHLMTGSALVIAIGMIVDNSIVVIESCFRHQKEATTFREAAVKGTKSVIASVTASTITTSVVYLPFAIMSGFAGQFLSEFGYTIIIIMVSSLLSAVTVVPLFYTLLKPTEKKGLRTDRILSHVTKAYRRMMPKLMKHRVTVIGGAVVLFTGAIALGATLNFELLPTTYDGSIIVEAVFRPGTTLESMAEQAGRIEESLLEDPHFKEVNMVIADSKASFTAYSETAQTRSSEAAVKTYNQKFKAYANMDVTVLPTGGNSSSLGFLVQPYTMVNLQSLELDQAIAAADALKEELSMIPGVVQVNAESGDSATQAVIRTDSLKAMRFGLTPAQVAIEIYYALNGVDVMSTTLDGKTYDLKVTYPDGTYLDANALMNKQIQTGMGGVITIGNIAEVHYEDVLQSRVRMDGKYMASLQVIPDAAHMMEVSSAVKGYMKQVSLPEGINVAETTDDRILNEELTKMAIFVFAGIFLVFLVMAMQFESPRLSSMVMMSIPFSFIGSIVMMRLFGINISLISMLGLMTLVGTVVNNGILFVDTANGLKRNMPAEKALIESGVIRLRPILMTTLTTVIAMIPMSLEKGGNTGMMSGLAIVIIGGLITSTLLILLFLPNFYLLIAGKKSETIGLTLAASDHDVQ